MQQSEEATIVIKNNTLYDKNILCRLSKLTYRFTH
jgi:hypothetical protein